jgi:hypothetical protein
MKPFTVFIDVDDTLVRSVGPKRIPMPGVLAELRRLENAGAIMYLCGSTHSSPT